MSETTVVIDMNPLISIIVPTYNRSKYIIPALNSALMQAYDNVEIIVVDDGSTDDTAQKLIAYGDRIVYLYQPNSGEAAARNTGISHSKGELIAFLDSDDIWLQGKLERQAEFLADHPEVGMVASHAIVIDDHGEPISGTPIYLNQEQGYVSLEANVLNSPLPIDTILVRRSLLTSPKPFTEGVHFGADWEMCLNVSARSSIWFMSEILAAVRQHPGNITAPLACQSKVERKLYDRLGVISRAFPNFAGCKDYLGKLRSRAEAREYAEAAIASYANGHCRLGSQYLQQAILLDRSTWLESEELVDALCNTTKLLFLGRGQDSAIAFLRSVSEHLPTAPERNSELMRRVYARTLIFTFGFESYRRQRPTEAIAQIVSGVSKYPPYLLNGGTISTLLKSLMAMVNLH